MPIVDSALELAQVGFRVFLVHGIRDGHCTCGKPGCSSPGKHPIARGWQRTASSDEAAVRALWKGQPDANIGLVTGAGLSIIDLDGADGLETLRKWEAEHGPLPLTCEVQTGGGGRHLFYQSEERIPNSVRKLGGGVDVRGEGGYVVAPGSAHISGGSYTWRPGHSPKDVPIAPLPDFIKKLMKTATKDEKPPIPSFNGQIAKGERNNALFRYGWALRHNGWKMRMINRELQKQNTEKCNPPMSKAEVLAIIDSVDRYKRGDGGEDFADIGGTITAAELQEKDLPPVRWIVDRLLPQGLAILASAPKFGKSWMALELSISVALGVPFLDFNTSKNGVLYLALEDSENRLKSRLDALMRNHGGFSSTNLCLRTKAPTIGTGLMDLLELHLGDHPDCQLIIIDTLQKIRDGALTNKEGAYQTDYREIGALKTFADKHSIALLLIHHLRKMGDDFDVMARISGTTGVTGAADTLMVLSRKRRMDQETTLSLTGRDVEAEEYSIAFDKEAKCWRMRGSCGDVEAQQAADRYAKNPIVKTIKALLTKTETWEGTMTELAGELAAREGEGYDVSTLGKQLMALAPELGKRDSIIHQPPEKGGRTGRVHHIGRAEL